MPVAERNVAISAAAKRLGAEPGSGTARSIPRRAVPPAVPFDRPARASRGDGGLDMAYELEGMLLEVCTCKAICPCWVGEDPDGGTCDGTLAWHFEHGTIDGVDVSGLTFGMLAHIPGNVLRGQWRAMAFVDERASAAQESAIVSVFSGKHGGPVADLAQLVGEVLSVERVPIVFDVEKGHGRFRMGGAVEAEIEPLRGAGDLPTTLTDAVFSSIPGSPAYVGKAPRYRARSSALGIDVDLRGHNSVQGHFRFRS
jgi:hypothetical protein